MDRLAILAFTALAGLSCSAKPPKPSEPVGLENYVGADLKLLDKNETKTFYERLDSLSGETEPREKRSPFELWWVRPFAVGDVRWIVLEAYPGYSVPDMSGVLIHLFDGQWRRLDKQVFTTGYRFFLNEVEIVSDNPLKQDLLVAKATCSGPFETAGNEEHPAFEQGDFQRQYYALQGTHFVLVRLADNAAQLAQNNYCWSSPSKGSRVPARTTQEWIRTLSSQDPVEQLATLVWLSGGHLSSAEPRAENTNQESVEDSRGFESVRDSAETKTLLKTLSHAENPWVRECAAFTIKMNASE